MRKVDWNLTFLVAFATLGLINSLLGNIAGTVFCMGMALIEHRDWRECEWSTN